MKIRRALKILLAVVVSAALLLLVRPAELVQALLHLRVSDALMLVAVSVALVYISALKWSLFVSALATPVAVGRLFALYLVGYFVNLLVPSYLGGDVARSWYVGQKIGQREALVATVLERFTGLLAMVALALFFLPYAPGVTPIVSLMVVVVAGGLVLGCAVVALPQPTAALAALFDRSALLRGLAPQLAKVRASIMLAAARPRLVVASMALSFLFHTVTVLNTAICAYAVGWNEVSWLELFVVLPLILLVGALPLTPQGLGIQEGAFVYFLSAIGATPAEALGIAVILRAKSYLLAAAGGLVWMSLRRGAQLTAKAGSGENSATRAGDK